MKIKKITQVFERARIFDIINFLFIKNKNNCNIKNYEAINNVR